MQIFELDCVTVCPSVGKEMLMRGGFGVRVGVGVGIGVLVGVGVGVDVLVGFGALVAVGVRVAVGRIVGFKAGVPVTVCGGMVGVAVGDIKGVGVGKFCAFLL